MRRWTKRGRTRYSIPVGGHTVVRATVRAGKLDQPGVGILFVMPVEQIVGMAAVASAESAAAPAGGAQLPG